MWKPLSSSIAFAIHVLMSYPMEMLVAGIIVAILLVFAYARAMQRSAMDYFVPIAKTIKSMALYFLSSLWMDARHIISSLWNDARFFVLCLVLLVVIVFLIREGVVSVLHEGKQLLCGTPLLSTYCGTVHALRAVQGASIDGRPIDDVNLCATYEWETLGTPAPPALALSLSISSNMISNISALYPGDTQGFADLTRDLDRVVSGMRKLNGLADNVIVQTQETYDAWAKRIDDQAGRLNAGFLVCEVFARLIEPMYSCAERTLPSKAHQSLEQSFTALAAELAAAVSLADRQHSALLNLHELLSEAWDTAFTEERRALIIRKSAWHPGSLAALQQRVDIARGVKSHCVRLRCSIQVALDALRVVNSSMKALATVVNGKAPSRELIQLQILLGSLVDGKSAVFKAASHLQRVLMN